MADKIDFKVYKMKQKFVLIIVLITVTFTCFAQYKDFKDSLSVPDTFKFNSNIKTKYVASLDSINGDIFDSITNPDAYFIYVHDTELYSWCIAFKKKEGYFVLNPFEYINVHGELRSLNYERMDFDSAGNDELIIYWQFYSANSWKRNGHHELLGGIQIWNLDNLVLLMNFYDYHHSTHWWNDYNDEKTGNEIEEDREGIDEDSAYSCESYHVEIANKLVTIRQTNHCPEITDDKVPIKDTTIYTFRYTDKGLIREK